MQRDARVVIVGSGIAGSSLAYHFTRLGWSDVVILEQSAHVSGTTSHAPGLVGQLRASPTLTRLLMESVSIYEGLAADGCEGFEQVGSLRIASTEARMRELEGQIVGARSVGLPAEMVTANEVVDRFPIIERTGIIGGVWLPTDGSARGAILAREMMRRAIETGANVYSHIGVTGFEIANGSVTGVRTTAGVVRTEIVVVAAGIWSPKLGAIAGVDVPLVPMGHQVVWTESTVELENMSLPNLRDPDNLFYVRQDGAALAYGGYETSPVSFEVYEIPTGPDPTRLEFDHPRFETIRAGAFGRIPRLADMSIERRLNGLESFTPDGGFLLGPTSSVRGLWFACGFCAHGVSAGAGVGKLVANWIANGVPGLDVTEMDIRRFGTSPPTGAELVRRVKAVYATYYALPSPSV